MQKGGIGARAVFLISPIVGLAFSTQAQQTPEAANATTPTSLTPAQWKAVSKQSKLHPCLIYTFTTKPNRIPYNSSETAMERFVRHGCSMGLNSIENSKIDARRIHIFYNC